MSVSVIRYAVLMHHRGKHTRVPSGQSGSAIGALQTLHWQLLSRVASHAEGTRTPVYRKRTGFSRLWCGLLLFGGAWPRRVFSASAGAGGHPLGVLEAGCISSAVFTLGHRLIWHEAPYRTGEIGRIGRAQHPITALCIIPIQDFTMRLLGGRPQMRVGWPLRPRLPHALCTWCAPTACLQGLTLPSFHASFTAS
ncbi:hypothetical protein BC834DRAFT_169239 [Gloeopeniophorella convolvens]|nr:hypothetical protein BC834DRAFT_169239 [Gloeopeniophorella convolvens]